MQARSNGSRVVSQMPKWHKYPETGRLVSRDEPWHGASMANISNKQPTGSGAIIAFLTLGGAIGGGLLGQPTIGLLAGLGLGVIIAVVLWMRER